MDSPEIAALSEVWARSFGSKAEDYDTFRPPLPIAVASWLGVQPEHSVVDVGAGTGQASRMLSAMGAHVVAVEADASMAQVLRSRSDGVETKLGTAEALPVASGSADLVLAVSAWHWFDQHAAFDEAARVVRPGGVLGIVWNGMDQTDPWGRRFMAATETADNTVLPPEVRPGPHALEPPHGFTVHGRRENRAPLDVASNP